MQTQTPKSPRTRKTRTPKKAPPGFAAQVRRRFRAFEKDAQKDFERVVDALLDRLGLVRKSKLETA